MPIFDAVEEALKGDPGARWQREAALALAADLDDKANASMVKELRALMTDIGAEMPEQTGDVADDLADRRAARRASTG